MTHRADPRGFKLHSNFDTDMRFNALTRLVLNGLSFVALLAATAAHAQYIEHGDVRCAAMPKEEMRPQMELQRKLVGEGWRVRKVQTYNGCYEVYGFDDKGERVEAFFNPKTFETIGRVKQEQ